MKNISCIFCTLLFPLYSLTGEGLKAHAESLSVYCADNNGNWDWLTDDRSNYVKVSGSWNSGERVCDFIRPPAPYITPDESVQTYANFIVEGGENKIRSLQTQCTSKFLTYNTPYVSYSNGFWYPLAVHKNKILNGEMTLLNYYVHESPIPSRNTQNFKNKNLYPEKEYITQEDLKNAIDCKISW